MAKTPYINHPIDVAHILMFEGEVHDPDVLVAAVLHDTVEDTETSIAEIEDIFGTAVADIVAEVTDDKNLPSLERKAKQIQKAPNISRNAKLVKLADKISNLRDILSAPPENWSVDRQTAYFEWSGKVIAGLRGTHAVLETLFDKVQADFILENTKNSPALKQETR